MGTRDLKAFRAELVALRRDLTGGVVELDGEAMRPAGTSGGGQPGSATGDPGDLSIDQARHDVTVAMMVNERQRLEQVNAALARLDAGRFGRCEECGRIIPRERLKALPFTPHCVPCARKLQQRAGGLPPSNLS
jgi:DnaK suppressor protein